MRATALIHDVAERIGGATESEAEAALDAVLSALGAKLPPADAAIVAEALPERFNDVLTSQRARPDMTLKEMLATIREREHVLRGFAIEHAQAVCAAIFSALTEQARSQLRIHVWPELLEPSLRDRSLTSPVAPLRAARTLASGRPGSQHPVSEAAPTRAQSHSVAREDNPHGDRKLSSGAASSDDAEHKIATAPDGSGHPLSRSRPLH